MTSAVAQSTLLDFLIYQLDRRLSAQCSDRARYMMLMVQGRLWRQRLVNFLLEGEQPFASGDFGKLLDIDFRLMLMEIDLRLTELEEKVAA